MTFKLTPKRLRALRLIQQRPGLRPAELTEVTDRQDAPWRKDGTWSGFDRPTANGAATRWGAGYAKPLIAAGLVYQKTTTIDRWVRTAYYLTALGQQVVRYGAMPPEDKG